MGDFGAIIIGDEILSGKRQDGHFRHTVETLAKRGLALNWCRIIGDDPALIIETLRQTYAGNDIVFCFGGIGATPDDHTRQCAAKAAEVPLLRHPEAVAEIEARFGAEAYPHRITMADMPQGSQIIPNPFNRIPGVSFRQHHFLPGFPQMAWPMMEWVLDTHYPQLRKQAPDTEAIITVYDTLENSLIDLMNEFVRRYPEVRFSSLPHIGEGSERRLELGVKGAQAKVEVAMAWLKKEIEKMNFKWTE
ncbi:MAG: competence/damage-inducible protein A [Gallionellales bacterium 35-53-114]|jgi:molybdopterin-biosynthesis enzyme MoeA-like protein|nr:MAG: competence/damage-inducible protein A [Gallionellales bacterium 35-53-114]OYZ62610.1 MAG: competence/damage-inducible protein A [Gallionellales bacterium 24-53-125]OZB09684.1 MAG: competence/damage-inducible protein A [Gallionellales bacterium 39-52-133]HQS57759.1 molybdopterin-binding protein [Gallionellaceae bacterium]HQS74212.1 molybdopterin-binding protein [Gallionellaceae bacterium]